MTPDRKAAESAAPSAPAGVEEIVAVLEKFARPGLFSEMAYDGDTTFIEVFKAEWRAARALLARLKDAPAPPAIGAVTAEEIVQGLAASIDELDRLAIVMDEWADNSRRGGWSTHQVDANIKQADVARRSASRARVLLARRLHDTL